MGCHADSRSVTFGHAEYDGTRFDIYDASPMFTDNGWVLVKCRAVA